MANGEALILLSINNQNILSKKHNGNNKNKDVFTVGKINCSPALLCDVNINIYMY